MIIKARDVSQDHIDRAVRTEFDGVFVLDNFSVVVIEPSAWCSDPGRVNLRDRRHCWHTVRPDDPIEVEQ